MSEPNQTPVPHTWVHDVLGICLVSIGAILLVSGVMFIRAGQPDEPALFASLMSGSVEVFGPAPILWSCIGFLFIGGRLFLHGRERGLVRDALGFLGTAAGLSILMGALSEIQGGSFGRAIGGVVPPIAGVLLGGALILTVAWAFWLRVAPALVAKAGALVGEGPVAETAGAGSGRAGARSAPRMRPATEDPSGVTSAEADALLPSAERDEILAALRAANRSSATTVNRAPLPYPADVRREGGIPEGTRPIDPPHEPRRHAPTARAAAPEADPFAGSLDPEPDGPGGARGASQSRDPEPGRAAGGDPRGAGSVRTWSASKPASGAVRAGADLAGDADARGAGAAPLAAPPATELRKAGGSRPATEAAAPQGAPGRGGHAPSGGAPASSMARAIPIPAGAGSPGSPSWETVDEETQQDAEEVAADEPADAEVVDAYGTPLELVAEIRGAPARGAEVARREDEETSGDDEETGAAAAWRAEDEASVAEELAREDAPEEPEATDDTEEGDDEPAAGPRAGALADDDDSEGLDEDEPDRVDPQLLADAEAALAEPEALAGDPEALAGELEDDARASEAPTQDRDEEPDADDLPPDPEAELDEDDAADGEGEPLAPRTERQVELHPVQNSLFEAPPAVETDSAKHAAARTEQPATAAAARAPQAPGAPAKPAAALSPKVPKGPEAPKAPKAAKTVASAEAPASEDARAKSGERSPAGSRAAKERTVVLEPAAPAAKSSDDLVYRCGLLFLEQKRVAVSMLQREFGLDFKQATVVLDQLQSQGLIGPYLGGQRRDILLTAEEWRAKVGAAS